MSIDVSEVLAASIIIALMMEAARTSETSVYIQLRTRQYIPEDSELHTRCHGNLKSYNITKSLSYKSITIISFKLFVNEMVSLHYVLQNKWHED
jgi:hypothetical protein